MHKTGFIHSRELPRLMNKPSFVHLLCGVENGWCQPKMTQQQKVRGVWHWGEAKRCYFVRFENRQEIKCYIPISFFFACGKCTGKPLDKGLNAPFGLWKTFEVRYQAAKKFGFRVVHVVYLQQRSQAVHQPKRMKKQYSLFIHSAFFDIMLPQKVRQVGLSETRMHC